MLGIEGIFINIMEKTKVVFSEGHKPLWKNFIAAALFTFFTYGMITLVRGFITGQPPSLAVIASGLFGLIYAVPLSLRSNFHFDLKKKKFKEELVLGPIKYGFWETAPDFEYVSVFRIRDDVYLIQLMFDRNQKLVIAGYSDSVVALEEGVLVAQKLKLDLWNATVPHNGSWFKK